ncbi:tripartite tricarboxylate transporter TctB family protein [uncultured Roseibium sp.]|uniref:tripartite tricarboxylate transporter TctB family protein n=1 Tax=uncultured Roseibium sp. TaxID=1936171 RepID=UPI002622878C|nr:tripartite tricarboxylate transporter TctB family protein [uncultured Roseibium sp.]
MNSVSRRIDPEVIVSAILGVSSALSIVFMSQLVAPPKVLFGRSLTAISPSLFPYLVLSGLVALNMLFLYRCNTRPEGIWSPPTYNEHSRIRGLLLFAIMLFYALAMAPIGFLISSVLALAMISILVGNRSVWQILLVSLLPPVFLYLVATRLLAVALPELSPIEFFYAYVLGESGGIGAAQ